MVLGVKTQVGLRPMLAIACAALCLTTAATTGSSAAAPQGGTRADLVVSRERLRNSINIMNRTARAGDCTLVERCLGGIGKRRTLEFDTYVINAGPEDLRLGKPSDRPNLYEYSPCHGHYHLKQSFVYGLAHGGTDTVALFDPTASRVVYRNANATGPVDGAFAFDGAAASSLPFSGDWDRLGASLAGLYDPATNQFTLMDGGSRPPIVFSYRPENAPLVPVAGDWDGDGRDTVGLYSAATHTFYLKKKNSKNKKAVTVTFTPGAGDWLPVAGDWDGDDVDSIGLYDPTTGTFALRNQNTTGAADVTFVFGPAGARPVVGDWNQDGVDTVGVYDPTSGQFLLRDANDAGDPDHVVSIEGSTASTLVPVAGDWDYNVGDLLVPGNKEAFCWLDTQRVTGGRDMQFLDCNENQGLTSGWCDIYIRNTDCQWIDITGLAPGTYQLTVTVNAAGLIPEADTTNNSASIKVRISAPKHQAKPPEVKVTAPRDAEQFAVGEPVTIRWKVARGRNVTHQEIWLANVEDDHPSKVLLIDGDVPPDARSYTWVPTEGFESHAAQIIVRAQDDGNFIGTDSRSKGAFAVGMHEE